jgi:hypothetical protein
MRRVFGDGGRKLVMDAALGTVDRTGIGVHEGTKGSGLR